MSEVCMGGWHLIETLTEGVATLVASGGETKNMISTRRSISPAADILVEPIIEHVRKTREPFERVLHSKRLNRAWRFYAWPIIGPFGDVHGIHMWVGDPKEKMTPRRLTSGVFWSTTDWLIYQTWESAAMSGTLLEDWVPTALSSDYINRAIHMEKEQEFLEITLAPKPGMVLSTWFSVRHDHGHAMQWQVILRPTADGKGVRVLYHDFSDAYPPSMPTLAELGLTEGLDGSKVHVALFEAHRGSIVLWIGRAPEWLEWQYAHLTGPVVHPDDLPTLQASAKRISLGEAPYTVDLVQLHRGQDEWVKSSVTMRPFQLKDRPAHAELTLIQVTPVDDH
ncbi:MULTISPECIES: GAF domain-containing protein [unclassified Rhodococcus (in: high G+C Gram-positive bacteria)]|uniref:GAF domain-containing protein n=1 Tax=unclassified Rhodococcus (in: high G+C Gram-positive bacteria) TaxID=192944 RepID=UPI00233E7D63|nr:MULTISPECIES: GAF domain-containing protein [unclassified Rhodococcus (in: high G+C Gram-positive bacteria)]WSE25634.1 GAF domain-containing protein [Rhodococcus sp. PD04]